MAIGFPVLAVEFQNSVVALKDGMGRQNLVPAHCVQGLEHQNHDMLEHQQTGKLDQVLAGAVYLSSQATYTSCTINTEQSGCEKLLLRVDNDCSQENRFIYRLLNSMPLLLFFFS